MKTVLLIGGSGFLGSAVARQLVTAGFSVRLPTRRRARVHDLLTLPTAEVIEANVHDAASLAKLMQGVDAVVNLVGVLKGGQGHPYGKGFAYNHVALPEKIVAAATASGVKRLVHVSAMQAAPDAPSGYLRSKAAGEVVVKASGLAWTILQPSVIFGRGDSFLSLFASLVQAIPFLPLACPEARFQPVWVEDVAATIVTSIQQNKGIAQTLPLCGPREYRLRELVAYASRLVGARVWILGLPLWLSRLQARLMEFVPGAPLSRDNIASMQVPNVCSAGCSFPFGREPSSLEAIAPIYLQRNKQA